MNTHVSQPALTQGPYRHGPFGVYHSKPSATFRHELSLASHFRARCMIHRALVVSKLMFSGKGFQAPQTEVLSNCGLISCPKLLPNITRVSVLLAGSYHAILGPMFPGSSLSKKRCSFDKMSIKSHLNKRGWRRVLLAAAFLIFISFRMTSKILR